MRAFDTAWVLGSGFSAGLGGPLLSELISPKARIELGHRYPTLATSGTGYAETFNLFEKGLSGNSGLWRHAEQFLEYLDSAVAEGTASNKWRVIAQVAGSNPAQIRTMARRIVAAQCAFTEDADLDSETWAPYVRWGRHHVGPNDAVITFNYDLVVEKLVLHRKTQHLALPIRASRGQTVSTPSKAWFLKLHGSINWVWDRDKNEICVPESSDSETLLVRTEQMVLASPGPAKTKAVNSHLEGLWEWASFVLENSPTVMFLGYRFPPSDSESRTRLLEAISKNDHQTLNVGLVLGPDCNHPDSVRLRALLGSVLRSAGRDGSPTATSGKRFRLVLHPRDRGRS